MLSFPVCLRYRCPLYLLLTRRFPPSLSLTRCRQKKRERSVTFAGREASPLLFQLLLLLLSFQFLGSSKWGRVEGGGLLREWKEGVEREKKKGASPASLVFANQYENASSSSSGNSHAYTHTVPPYRLYTTTHIRHTHTHTPSYKSI